MYIRLLIAFTLLFPAGWSFARDDGQSILMIAGRPSHGYGAHEHYAGLRILAEAIESSSDSAEVTIVKGWPDDDSLIQNADSIVIYSDGGKGHPAIRHLKQLRSQLETGCGFVCIHYAVEMVPGEPGDWMVDMLGGHFEINWSVNPHWVGDFQALPEHPITRGVEPFATNDEWYFHLRFKDSDKVTPILSAIAPEETMRRPDGPHSGNPAVRKSVAAGEPQTVAWAYERPDGGRSFGITGGHFHWNWGQDDMRRLVTNAIRWTAGEAIATGGSSLGQQTVGVEKLLENQDFRRPKKLDLDKIKQQYNLQSAVPADIRDAANAISGLQVAEGLEITLAASEPNLKSLSSMDIDDRGRVWVMEVMNYGPKFHGVRPEGDRIVICEDTTGDGVMDLFQTFYQGTEIDSAMGICVLGNEVIVSASPNIFRLIDTDGDDRADKKELMFSGVGERKHDHSAHAFKFGPDGKLYWNFGNAGKQIKTASGETVIDVHGRPVIDNGKPFFGGMPFRCDVDGSNLEVLAHNFRNNWEVAVDSFGGLWQSDNDDDGNRGTRINFVMEHGNYGYRDELTGAGWKQPRIGMSNQIPLRHWHLNDPGVVPNLLQTGAGSPAGLCIYEGRLLPERFWDQMIHCDPGPNVVRAYPTKPSGAGYTASIEPLVTGTTDKWFRPIDVRVAPDGSLFVTDWYDPGVGGHNYEDRERGRLFRIAPPGTPYRVPEFDYQTAAGAVAALRNPNLAVRHQAWVALRAMGSDAESELSKLYADQNPRLRARALWLLGKIVGRGEHYVAQAIADPNPDLRITAIRLAKQLGLNPAVVCGSLASDASAAVRRELAIALRFDDSDSMPAVWARLAQAHDGKDRWYLEALGIGSDIRPDECFAAWWEMIVGDSNTAAGHDILWRLRAPQTADLIGQLLAGKQTDLSKTDRFFRALDYHPADVRSSAMKSLVAQCLKNDLDQQYSDAIVVRAVERIQDDHLAQDESVQAAIARHMQRLEGTSDWIALAKRFKPTGMHEQLAELIVGDLPDQSRVDALRMLLVKDRGREKLRQVVWQGPAPRAETTVNVLAMLGNRQANRLMLEIAADPELPFAYRKVAIGGLSKGLSAAKGLIDLAKSDRLPGDSRLLAGGLLSRSTHQEICDSAQQVFPQPRQKDQQPLPPLDQLARQTGDAGNGAKLFRGTATCAKCHPVGDQGKPVGPALSEIGSKLSREAILTAILDPNAGISHNYETFVVLTVDGQVVNGLLTSETREKVVIRTADAIDRIIQRDEIESMKKSDKSMMPENLHHLVDQQGLIDIVEYLTTLRKSSS